MCSIRSSIHQYLNNTRGGRRLAGSELSVSLTWRFSLAPASISIWTAASSPAEEAYMRGVMPCRDTGEKHMIQEHTAADNAQV